MQPTKLDNYVNTILPLIKNELYDLRVELMKYYGNVSHTNKSDGTALTKLDELVEKRLSKLIQMVDPDVGIYGEEFGVTGNKDTFWTLDPIDGTESFIRGLPFCSNMLCLINGDDLIASVIYSFVQDEMHVAIKGRGATCNNKSIKVSSVDIKKSGIEFESKITFKDNIPELFFGMPRYSVYSFGKSSGFRFVLVAKGTIEASVVYKGPGLLYDYAPGALLIKEAGGVVANIGSKDYNYKNGNFIASNKTTHKALQDYFIAEKATEPRWLDV